MIYFSGQYTWAIDKKLTLALYLFPVPTDRKRTVSSNSFQRHGAVCRILMTEGDDEKSVRNCS